MEVSNGNVLARSFFIMSVSDIVDHRLYWMLTIIVGCPLPAILKFRVLAPLQSKNWLNFYIIFNKMEGMFFAARC